MNRRLMTGAVVGCGLVIALQIATGLSAAEQATAEGEVVFEVASIRLNTNAADIPGYQVSKGGLYRATRVRPLDLILQAYGIRRSQLVGGPSWMASERFDIVGRATGELTTTGSYPTLPPALRELLKSRFKLVEHEEVREFSVYALKVVQQGRLGPNISPSNIDCAAIPIGDRKAGQCTVSAPGMTGKYFANSTPLRHLVAALDFQVGRPIVDQTDLKGNYTIELNWSPGQGTQTVAEITLPSIFIALQEQLGLTLESTTTPMKVVVIDGLEYPTND